MTTLTLDIPDSQEELVRWLERQLLGSNLGNIVDELRAVHGPALEAHTLDDVLGDALPLVLDSGLKVLSRPQLQALLLEPQLLLDLQEQVCIGGGRYWSRNVAVDPAVDRAVRRGRFRLASALSMQDEPVVAVKKPAARGRRYIGPLVTFLATAALLLVAFGVWTHTRDWGFEKQRVLADDVGRDVYLNRLASAADEWFAERPTTASGVADRLSHMRKGCTDLILAPKKSLPPADQKWVNERCAAWAKLLDKHMQDLDAGRDPGDVRNEADGTVRNLAQKLRQRAAGA